MTMALLNLFKKRCANCTKELGAKFIEEGKLRFCSAACRNTYTKKKKGKKTCEFC